MLGRARLVRYDRWSMLDTVIQCTLSIRRRARKLVTAMQESRKVLSQETKVKLFTDMNGNKLVL
jgi:hypothetical protein